METPEIVCIIDRSGSMQEIRDDAIGSFNAFLEEQKKLGDEALVTLVLFDDQYEVIYNAAKLSKVQPFSTSTYIPRGTTALFDAIGRTIAAIDARLPEQERENSKENMTIAILTDGHENASREFTREQILTLIEARSKKRGWDFIYLSADPEAFDSAHAIGIHQDNVLHFCKDSAGIKNAYMSMNRAIESKRRRGKLNDWKNGYA